MGVSGFHKISKGNSMKSQRQSCTFSIFHLKFKKFNMFSINYKNSHEILGRRLKGSATKFRGKRLSTVLTKTNIMVFLVFVELGFDETDGSQAQ